MCTVKCTLYIVHCTLYRAIVSQPFTAKAPQCDCCVLLHFNVNLMSIQYINSKCVKLSDSGLFCIFIQLTRLLLHWHHRMFYKEEMRVIDSSTEDSKARQ